MQGIKSSPIVYRIKYILKQNSTYRVNLTSQWGRVITKLVRTPANVFVNNSNLCHTGRAR